jgi:hypothetical protein
MVSGADITEASMAEDITAADLTTTATFKSFFPLL